ncbi:MAG TPA: ABC transporter substrate-binding protein [Candidatus Binatia bacterium]|jgi:putative ABC transport system substrate-binding protein
MKEITVVTLSAMLFALCFPAEAQQPKKVSRVGYLSSTDPTTDFRRSEPIRLALRELGYIEGQNIAFDYRYSQGKLDRLPELAAELVRLKVNLIVVSGGDPEIRAAKNATTRIPIVMVGVGTDPVKAGFIESLAYPGGNVTGITNLGRELGGKRLELLKEAVPKVVHVAILYDPDAQGTAQEIKEGLPITARAMGLTIKSSEIRNADDLEEVFGALNKARPDGLFVPGGGREIRANVRRIAGFALKNRLPAMYGIEEAVRAGGLMYYGADLADSYRRVAYYVDRILKGAKPGELPVEQPTKFELVINLKTARQIGLIISPNVLARADKVIK